MESLCKFADCLSQYAESSRDQARQRLESYGLNLQPVIGIAFVDIPDKPKFIQHSRLGNVYLSDTQLSILDHWLGRNYRSQRQQVSREFSKFVDACRSEMRTDSPMFQYGTSVCSQPRYRTGITIPFIIRRPEIVDISQGPNTQGRTQAAGYDHGL